MPNKRRKATDRQAHIVQVWRELERSYAEVLTVRQGVPITAELVAGTIPEVLEALEVYGIAGPAVPMKRAGRR